MVSGAGEVALSRDGRDGGASVVFFRSGAAGAAAVLTGGDSGFSFSAVAAGPGSGVASGAGSDAAAGSDGSCTGFAGAAVISFAGARAWRSGSERSRIPRKAIAITRIATTARAVPRRGRVRRFSVTRDGKYVS